MRVGLLSKLRAPCPPLAGLCPQPCDMPRYRAGGFPPADGTAPSLRPDTAVWSRRCWAGPLHQRQPPAETNSVPVLPRGPTGSPSWVPAHQPSQFQHQEALPLPLRCFLSVPVLPYSLAVIFSVPPLPYSSLHQIFVESLQGADYCSQTVGHKGSEAEAPISWS